MSTGNIPIAVGLQFDSDQACLRRSLSGARWAGLRIGDDPGHANCRDAGPGGICAKPWAGARAEALTSGVGGVVRSLGGALSRGIARGRLDLAVRDAATLRALGGRSGPVLTEASLALGTATIVSGIMPSIYYSVRGTRRDRPASTAATKSLRARAKKPRVRKP